MSIRKFFDFGMATTGALALAMGLVACGDDSSSGSDDSSLTPVESEIDLAGGKKVTCDEKMEGVVAALANGDFRRCEDGAWIKISREEALKADEILGYSSSSAKAVSSSSGKVTSSSSVPAGNVGSSSSATPAVDPDPVPEIYECPDGSFVENEEDCPSVSSSSSTEEPDSGDSSDSDEDGVPVIIENGSMTDSRDGQKYETVKICDKKNENCQTWMAENLKYNPGSVSSLGKNAWHGCYDEGKMPEEQVAANCAKYGRLYTWVVAMSNASCAYGKTCDVPLNPTTPVRGVCPAGWHMPSHREFETLINYVDPSFGYGHATAANSSTAGKYLKSQSIWKNDGEGMNALGFSALPAGYRNNDDEFINAGDHAYIWSSGEYNGYFAFYLRLDNGNESAALRWEDKRFARSVRCIQNTNEEDAPESSSGDIPDPDLESSSSDTPESSNAHLAWAYLNQNVDYDELKDPRDGQVYKTITIGEGDKAQTWMAENLNYGGNLKGQSWCGGGEFNTQKEGDCSLYGRLYTWDAAMEACPEGWYLPSMAGWNALYTAVGGNEVAGKNLKAKADLWFSNTGTDEYGFSMLPAGMRGERDIDGDVFDEKGTVANFWSSTVEDGGNAWVQYFLHDKDYRVEYFMSKGHGFSVRCLKGSPDQGTGNRAWLALNFAKAYGEFSDRRDDQVYKTIRICDKNNENCQTWMAENLNYSMEEGSRYVASGYGHLYTWEAAKTACPNVFPNKWRLPTKEEWLTLVNSMASGVSEDGYYIGAGVELKSAEGWTEYTVSTKGTNASGFSALPAGRRNSNGDYAYANEFAGFWSASESQDNYAYYLHLSNAEDYAEMTDDDKSAMFSIRCIEDSN